MRWGKVAPRGRTEAWPRRHGPLGADCYAQPLRLRSVRGEARSGATVHGAVEINAGARCTSHQRGELRVKRTAERRRVAQRGGRRGATRPTRTGRARAIGEL